MKKYLIVGSLLVWGCGADKDAETSSENEEQTETESDVTESGCPPEVPEEYQYLWDCEQTSCDPGAYKVYHYAEGSSTADGSFSATEKWFVFDGSSYCIDTFEIDGQAVETNPSTFDCSFCEEIFEINWRLTDSQCGWIWSKTFADQESEDQNYYGFLMFDTHASLTGERNEDNKILVVAAPVNRVENTYSPNNDYGRGTATPTSEVDGMPEDYVWASSGDCYGN